jgi:two-component system, chemotaxis family, response regulator Rcp1
LGRSEYEPLTRLRRRTTLGIPIAFKPMGGAFKMRSLKFLLVEDNDADAYYLKIVLDRMGIAYSMEELKDGEKAVQYLLKRGEYANVPDPDLIFLDLNLPKRTGVEVLKSIPRSRHLSFCILTGSTRERDELKKAFGIRRIAYVVKPVSPGMVLNCFRAYDALKPFAEAIASSQAREATP